MESKDNVVIKSPADRRSYRLLRLPNGLRALLVHDPEIYPNDLPEPSRTHAHDEEEEEEDSEEDVGEEEESEGDEDEEEEDGDGDGSEQKKAKGSRATKKGRTTDVKGQRKFENHWPETWLLQQCVWEWAASPTLLMHRDLLIF